ncbi:MAG TPA: L,D-transpeptidase [Anaerolineae bacterium]|nr:L,D-transpeptidase [Anaerolineae bacterium]
MTNFFAALVVALLVALATVSPMLAYPISTEPWPEFEPLTPPANQGSITGLTYARVITGNVPVYASPADAVAGQAAIRQLAPGYVWVSLAGERIQDPNGTVWYGINEAEYVQADYLQLSTPSAFHGTDSPRPGRFAWIVFQTYTSPRPGVVPNGQKQWLKRYDMVSILEERMYDQRLWYRIAKGHWVEQGSVGIIAAKPRPEGVGPDEKWIEVDLYEQTLAAYEGDRLVYATLVSSGLSHWATVTGLYRVWVKIERGKMSGSEGQTDYYYLEDVPWSLYFHKNYALHGAYWHNRFGIKHSHGCVNLAPADARWLFEWAGPAGQTNYTVADEENPGTWVWIHE